MPALYPGVLVTITSKCRLRSGWCSRRSFSFPMSSRAADEVDFWGPDCTADWPRLPQVPQGIHLIPTTAPDFFTEDTPTAVLVRQVLGAMRISSKPRW